MVERFDAIVVGAGQAGPSLAARLASEGMAVAIVERHHFGGTCVNTGCTPTKAMVASAHAAHMARRAADYGVEISGTVTIDMAAVKDRKDKMVEKSRTGLERWLGGLDKVSPIRGHVRFIGDRTLAVGDRHITAPRIFLNVGGRAVVPDYPGVHEIEALTNSTILDLDTVPRHLVVVGGGYVGLEFAQMFRRFGSAVTVIERGDRLLKREDEDTSETVAALLEAEGIELRLNADCVAFSQETEGPTVKVDCTEGAPSVAGSHVLLAVGRRPNTDDLGLDVAGIVTDERDYIVTDDALETNVEGIWALGDCNGRGAFTHTAYNDYEIVAGNLIDGAGRAVTDRTQAYALYTDPPLGRAGMTVAEAKAAGRRVLIGKRPMTRVARATEKGETTGFMKVIVDADSERIIGGAVFGVGGDEAVHVLVDAIQSGAPYTALRDTMHIHPTVSELIPTILGELEPVED
ncbi:FAD-containing oxidoreductase [Pelagibacterium halotolerans]|uniref:FAD-containing oxidoreductase n=1 Tax=Pelagibacterium halotolerans TaxID=531813 RepID=UPI00384B10CB